MKGIGSAVVAMGAWWGVEAGVIILYRVVRASLIVKVISEQKPSGGKEMSPRTLGRIDFQPKGTRTEAQKRQHPSHV